MSLATLELHDPHAWIRLGLALVWLVFGLLFKALGAVPRHAQIVARVVGPERARPTLRLVALGEVVLGLWVLAGFLPLACAAAQTVTVVAMNTLELRHARDLLLSPVGMVCANVVFLAAAWYVALATP